VTTSWGSSSGHSFHDDVEFGPGQNSGMGVAPCSPAASGHNLCPRAQVLLSVSAFQVQAAAQGGTAGPLLSPIPPFRPGCVLKEQEDGSADSERQSLYAEVTQRVITELEAGRLPWVQPWESARCGCTMPQNAGTGRPYSGINVLILWATVVMGNYKSQRWLTYRQAELAGGNVRKGEKGTTVCYADRFTPNGEDASARDEDREASNDRFLKRFTVFNIDQCEGLPQTFADVPELPEAEELIPHAEALIQATGADFRIGDMASYAPQLDFIAAPPKIAYPDQVNGYRTALHELGNWTGHSSRLNRDLENGRNSKAYAREELVAELLSAFTCATLGIRPTVRHAGYIGAWLEVLREDERAIFRAASLEDIILLGFGHFLPQSARNRRAE
jgi:antirestriction protein ArdC